MSNLQPNITFSCIIPASAKDAESQNLKDLIASIKAQDFPQDQIEILVITEGDSEQAKAIGIKRAKGEICAMFCADNVLTNPNTFKNVKVRFDLYDGVCGVYSNKYAHIKEDNSLNRYFSLIGGNDPICYYLGKNDREPHVESLKIRSSYQPSYGCNGFFFRSDLIKRTDLDNYYPMDNAGECLRLEKKGRYLFLPDSMATWHKTSDNLISFLKKRYRYARDLYCERRNRRWKIIDTREDKWRLFLFVLFTLTAIQPLSVSLRGYLKIRDWAWWLHWPVCLGFLFTYGLLTLRNLLKHGRPFQCRQSPSLSRPLAEATR